MADISLLLSIGSVSQFTKNQIVFMQNDIGKNMYIVLKGEFGVYIDSFSDFPIRVAGIKQGSFFGEMSVIDNSPRSATIISEDESTALVVEREKFVLLLEKAPDIAASMMETLRNRAESTAKAVREAGKEAAELPPLFKKVQYRDAKSSMAFMTALAKRVREMNTLLCAPKGSDYLSELLAEALEENSPKHSKSTAPEILAELPAQSVSDKVLPSALLQLLPEGYIPFNINDENDNRFKLNIRKFICPFCAAEVSAPVPVFSSLSLKSVEMDGRAIYNHFDILRYTNIVCSNCNYTDAYQEFGKPVFEIQKDSIIGNQFKNVENFIGFSMENSHSLDETIKSYYLNLACLKRTTNDPMRFAKAWIRLYWLYGDHGSTEFAKQSAVKAGEFYGMYLAQSGDNISVKDKMQLNAILGELAFTLDDKEKSVQYYKESLAIGRDRNDEFFKLCLRRYSNLK